ncbi:MAG: ABC transporter substrate-binding protein [Leptolyngbyaceae cyanobacterium bins.302]|nr:ABC transporter substrate-binding protein [Leptolyngbyaceae cyanobacterium bins.302]
MKAVRHLISGSRRQSQKIARLSSIAFLLGVAACQTQPPSTHLKIGTLLPVTGDLSQYGGSMQDSAQLLVQQVNQCGGVLGQPVELVAEDDQTDPSAGASAMTKLAEVDRVTGVVGAASSAVSSAAVDIAVRNQVVMISPSSTSPIFTERSRQGDFQGFWFRTAPPDTYQGEALARLAQTQDFKTVAILAVNNDYGNGLVASFIPAFEGLGGTIVNKDKPVRYPPDSSVFDSEVGSAFKDEPDAVLLIAYPETGGLILKTAYQQGVLGKKTQVLLTDGMKEPGIAAAIGKNAAGKYIAAGMLGSAPRAGGAGLSQFQKAYQVAFKRQPKIYDPNTWDATALLVLATEAAKSSTADAIKGKILEVANPPGEPVTDVCQALSLIRAGKSINYEGTSGSSDLNNLGDVAGSYDIWTITPGGGIKTIGTIAVSGQ